MNALVLYYYRRTLPQINIILGIIWAIVYLWVQYIELGNRQSNLTIVITYGGTLAFLVPFLTTIFNDFELALPVHRNVLFARKYQAIGLSSLVMFLPILFLSTLTLPTFEPGIRMLFYWLSLCSVASFASWLLPIALRSNNFLKVGEFGLLFAMAVAAGAFINNAEFLSFKACFFLMLAIIAFGRIFFIRGRNNFALSEVNQTGTETFKILFKATFKTSVKEKDTWIDRQTPFLRVMLRGVWLRIIYLFLIFINFAVFFSAGIFTFCAGESQVIFCVSFLALCGFNAKVPFMLAINAVPLPVRRETLFRCIVIPPIILGVIISVIAFFALPLTVSNFSLNSTEVTIRPATDSRLPRAKQTNGEWPGKLLVWSPTLSLNRKLLNASETTPEALAKRASDIVYKRYGVLIEPKNILQYQPQSQPKIELTSTSYANKQATWKIDCSAFLPEFERALQYQAVLISLFSFLAFGISFGFAMPPHRSHQTKSASQWYNKIMNVLISTLLVLSPVLIMATFWIETESWSRWITMVRSQATEYFWISALVLVASCILIWRRTEHRARHAEINDQVLQQWTRF